MSVPVLQPRAYFALRPGIKQNAHYVTDYDVVYPAGSALIVHNHTTRRQRFIKLYEKSVLVDTLVVSQTRQYIALVLVGEKPQIIIYDIQALKKKRTLNTPPESSVTKFESICFSHDDKYIMAVTKDLEPTLVTYRWGKGKIENMTKANYQNSPATVTQVYCSPSNNGELFLIGNGLFRLLTMTETVWRQYGFQKVDQFNLTTGCWLTDTRVMLGTEDGKLILVDHGDFRGMYDAASVTSISTMDREELSNMSTSSLVKAKRSFQNEDNTVRSLIAFHKGFAFSCLSGTVHLFEKESPTKYKKRNLFRINEPDFQVSQVDLNIIRHLSVNLSQDKMLATTLKSQLYGVRLWGPDLSIAPQLPFRRLGEYIHHGPIRDLAVCLWKPIFLTCGEIDRTVRVWNYETLTLEFVKQYEEDVYSTALHPTGQFAIIGFRDSLKFMIILMNDIKPEREFPIKQCQLSEFSSHGHYFAAANHSVIQVYSTISFQNVFNLTGHTNRVKVMNWSPDDRRMLSCDLSGNILKWDVVSGTLISSEATTDEATYNDCVSTADGKHTFGIGSDNLLKEMIDGEVVRVVNLKQSHMDHIVLSQSDHMLFLCGDDNTVLSVKMPLLEPPQFLSFNFHNSEITKMKLAYDDTTLITVSKAGSLCIWKVMHTEGKAALLDNDFEYSSEVLINKSDLEQKISLINELAQTLWELDMAQTQKMQDTKAVYVKKIRDIHEKYNHLVEELRDKNQQLEMVQISELLEINEEVCQLKEREATEKHEMEMNYTGKLLVEYEKFQVLDTLKEEMVAEYEAKLAELQKLKERAIELVEEEFEEQTQEINEQLRLSLECNSAKVEENEKVKQQTEDDADREIVETKAKFEAELKVEKDNIIKLRGEVGAMRKKYIAAQKEIEEYKNQVSLLQIEHEKFLSAISSLEKDIVDLKKEITERTLTIQDKEKRIYDLKKKIQELEKFKFVLDYKIKELENQLSPKDREIREKSEQIADMESELDNIQKMNTTWHLQIIELKEKIKATEVEMGHLKEKHLMGFNILKYIKMDLYNLYGELDNHKNLQEGIKVIYHKYNENEQFLRSKPLAPDLQQEFMKQREFLEGAAAALRRTITKNKEQIKQDDGSKVLQDNAVLTEELNMIRKELKIQARKRNVLEKILSIKPGKVISPTDAFRRLQLKLNQQEAIRLEHRSLAKDTEERVNALKAEVTLLVDRIAALEEGDIEHLLQGEGIED